MSKNEYMQQLVWEVPKATAPYVDYWSVKFDCPYSRGIMSDWLQQWPLYFTETGNKLNIFSGFYSIEEASSVHQLSHHK